MSTTTTATVTTTVTATATVTVTVTVTTTAENQGLTCTAGGVDHCTEHQWLGHRLQKPQEHRQHHDDPDAAANQRPENELQRSATGRLAVWEISNDLLELNLVNLLRGVWQRHRREVCRHNRPLLAQQKQQDVPDEHHAGKPPEAQRPNRLVAAEVWGTSSRKEQGVDQSPGFEPPATFPWSEHSDGVRINP